MTTSWLVRTSMVNGHDTCFRFGDARGRLPQLGRSLPRVLTNEREISPEKRCLAKQADAMRQISFAVSLYEVRHRSPRRLRVSAFELINGSARQEQRINGRRHARAEAHATLAPRRILAMPFRH